MNIIELEDRLRSACVREDAYSLNGDHKNEAYILEASAGDGWRIYYSERGLRSGERIFATEGEACCCFLDLLLGDPLVKQSGNK